MSSKTEGRALAVLLLLGTLGCPQAEPLSLPPPPPLSVPSTNFDDAGIAQVPGPGPGPAPLRVETLQAVVFEFGGKAEVRRGGTGEWVDLAVGDAVRVEDQVRTSADGHLQLSFGAARIQVHEDSELTLRFLEPRAIRAEVRGLASGDAADGGELTFEGAGAVATATGQLSMDANEHRSIASSLSGGARLTSGGSTVELKSGQSATAQGTGITKSAPLPRKVSLQIGWPSQPETNQPILVLKGHASAYSRVLVLGRRVDLAPDGSFEARIELKKGSQSVSIVAIDPLGRRATEKRQITFDPKAPAIKAKVEYR